MNDRHSDSNSRQQEGAFRQLAENRLRLGTVAGSGKALGTLGQYQRLFGQRHQRDDKAQILGGLLVTTQGTAGERPLAEEGGLRLAGRVVSRSRSRRAEYPQPAIRRAEGQRRLTDLQQVIAEQRVGGPEREAMAGVAWSDGMKGQRRLGEGLLAGRTPHHMPGDDIHRGEIESALGESVEVGVRRARVGGVHRWSPGWRDEAVVWYHFELEGIAFGAA